MAMKKIKIIILLWVSLTCPFLTGYSQQIVLKINSKSKSGLSDINIDNVRLIPLETNPNSLLGQINDIQTDNSNLFILDRKNQVLKRFDIEGNYLNDIGKSGNGPGEFGRIFCFCVVPEMKSVIISDQTGKALLFYSYEGKYIKSIDLPASVKKIKALDASTIVCHHGRMSNLRADQGSFFEVICYDHLGVPGFDLFPFNQSRYFDLLPGLEPHPDNHSLLYHKAFDYHIYEISKSGQLDKLYHFDFKHNNVDTSQFSMDGVEGLKNLASLKHEIIGFSEVNMTKTHLLLKVHSNEEATYLIVDRKLDKWTNYPLDESGYIGRSGYVPIPFAMEIYNDFLVGIIYPVDIILECESNKISIEDMLKNVSYQGNSKSLEEDNNPILMFYQLTPEI